MKSINNFNKIFESNISKDGKSCKIENTKIKQSSCPNLIKLLKENSNISNLTIKSCRLKVLPSEISTLGGNLKKLHIEDNKIQEIPNLEPLDQLDELILSNNDISKFQVSISKLPSLRVLDLSYNQLGTIPVRLFYLSSLRVLILDNNQFSHFPSHLCELKQLTTLGFSGNGLKTIPTQIGQMTGLKKLILAGNQLESVPIEISSLLSLSYLDLSSNCLTSLPVEYGKLVNLEYLLLQHNRLRSIPDEVAAGCKSLLSLRINNNAITLLPSTIGQLVNLSELYLQENRLTTLPKEIGDCVLLKKLYLEYNKIISLPDEEFSKLNCLNVLTLHDNQLEELPTFLTVSFFKHLIRFTIYNNKFLKDYNIEVVDSLKFLNQCLLKQEQQLQLLQQQQLQQQSLDINGRPILQHNSSFIELNQPIYLNSSISNNNLSSVLSSSSCSNSSYLRSPSSNNKKSINNTSSNNLLVHLNQNQNQNQNNNYSNNNITPKLNFKSLVSSRDFSSEESDSDTDSTISSSFSYSKRSSLSPRTSLTLSNSISNDSVSALANGSNGLVNSYSSLSLSSQINYHNVSRARRGTNGNGGDMSPSSSSDKLSSQSTLSTPRQHSFLNSVLNRRKSTISSNGPLSLSSSNLLHYFNNNNNNGHNNNNNNGGGNTSNNNGISNTSISLNNSYSAPGSGASSPNLQIFQSNNNSSISHSNSSSSPLKESFSFSSLSSLQNSTSGVTLNNSQSTIGLTNSNGSINNNSNNNNNINNLNNSSNSNSNNMNNSSGNINNSSGNINNNVNLTPIYKSFQSIFETLLDELDYSKRRRDELLNLSAEDKWIFLQRIKPDCTNSLINNGIYQYQNQISSNDLKTLISSPPKLNSSQQHLTLQKSLPSLSVSSSPKSPRGHLKVLHLNSLLTFEDIAKLKQQFLSKPVSWVINFAESTGIVSILSMISTFSNNKEMKTEDYLVINECLLCIKLLIELEMQSLLLTDTAEIIFPLVLSPILSTKRLTFEILDLLCKTFYLGSTIVLESIQLYSRKSNQSLEKVFSFITTPLDGEFAADLKVNCMSLINHLINTKQSTLNGRIEIRSKFLSNEILLILKNLRIDGEGIETSSWKQLDNEMKLFETMMVDDNNQISLIENESNGGGSNLSVNSNSNLLNSNNNINSSINNNNNNNNDNKDGSLNGDTRSNSFNENSSFSSASNINSIGNSSEFNGDNQELLKSSLNNEIVLNENKLIVIVSFHQKNKYKSRKQQIQIQQQQQQQLQFQKQLDDDDDDEENEENTNGTLEIESDQEDEKKESNSEEDEEGDEEDEDIKESNKSSIQNREVIVPVQRRSKASDIIRSLLSSNSNLKELGEWGLYVIDKNNTGSFLKDDEFIFEIDEQQQQQQQQQNLIMTPRNLKLIPRFKEYRLKMIPWKVRISLEKVKEMGIVGNFTTDKCIAESPMDPTMTCSGLVYHLLKKHMPNVYSSYCLEPDDFGLYLEHSSTAWSGNTGSGYWLEPLEKLHDYDEIFKDPKLTVQLKLRPKGVKLKFADGTFEIFKLNLMLPTEKIFQEISEKVIDSNNNINLSYYGIFIDRQLDGTGNNTSFSNLNISSSFKETKKPEWLEKGLPLYHYKINDRCCLRFALRPSNISLSIDLSLFNKFKPKEETEEKYNDSDDSDSDDSDSDDDDNLEFPSSNAAASNSNSKLSTVKEDNNLLQKFQDVLNFNLPEKTQIQYKEITVKLPLHLPLGEALEIDECWMETGILREKCSFHFDSFDGQPLNQNQPLNNQNFTEKNKIFVLLAEEEHNDQMDEFNKVNIWEEPFDSTTIICDPDNPGQIRAATLNKLLEQATNNIEKDRELMNILLMTYMSFSTSDILLDKLIERYNVPEHEKDQKSVVQLHTIVFLKNWLEQQAPQAASGGGLEEKFLVRLSDFVDRQITNDGYTKIVPQLKKWIDSALKEKRAYAMPEASRPNTSKLSTLSISSKTLLDEELFVAQQLTVREYDTFKRIQAVEFLGQSWSKAKLQYKAKNLLKMIERFNKYSTGISTAILSQASLKSRVKLICRFIKIAQHCRDLNNYHLLTAFMAGIRNSNVIRLRLTWEKVPKKYLHILEDLEKIMSMEGSFKEFRQRMAETIPPCIPYLGVYLKDLTFIEEGNPDTINSLINWSKKKLIFNIVSIIQRCQQVSYDFGQLSQLNQVKSEMVLNYFDTLPTAADELLYKISLNLEPKQQSINK